MNALEQLAALAGREIGRRETERERNRERFLAAAELMDMFNAGMPCPPGTRGHRITCAENFKTGETIGEAV